MHIHIINYSHIYIEVKEILKKKDSACILLVINLEHKRMTQEPSQSLTETVLSTAASGIFLSTKQPLTTASRQQQRLLMEVRVWVILASQHVVLFNRRNI